MSHIDAMVAIIRWHPPPISDYRTDSYGFSGWLSGERKRRFGPYPDDNPPIDKAWIVPRGLAAALIMTAVSSLILCVAWRAAVNAFPCVAGTCDACGYDLRALRAARCPECGEEQR